MPAALAPPPAAPSSNPPAPKSGPSVAAVNMPTPPSVSNAPVDAPSGVGDMFDKYAKPAEEGLIHKNNRLTREDEARIETKAEPEPGESPAPKPESAKADNTKALADKAEPDKAKPAQPEPGKKVSPWKLVEEHKGRAAKAEAEVVELRKLVGNEAERKTEVERLTKAEARAKELEDHLRFIDYQNHPEFQEKFQKPYDDHWNRVMRRLSGVKITNEDGSVRGVDVKDILELGSLPADVVMEKAEAKFGKLGTWVAERVEELKQLSEDKASALDKAKTEGIQKQKDAESAAQKQHKEIAEFLNQTWEKAHKELAEHSRYAEYFKSKEGDEEHNEVLEKGEKFVQKAWLESPLEPGLSKEEREARTKRQAKMQKFAQGFGAQHLTIKRQIARIAQLESELAQFKGSEPKTEGQRPEPTNGTPGQYDMNSFEQALLSRARPGVLG